jgi:DNA-3-methyladenine glycosylase
MKKLDISYYLNDDVVEVARDLLGKVLFSVSGGVTTVARITETEAYAGVDDKASHAYDGKLTARTRVMFRKGGCAYIYLCYGIHSMLNVVTNAEGVPHAVLIRGLEPMVGIEQMASRLGKSVSGTISGPGLSARAMGIHYSMSGISLLGDNLWISEDDVHIDPSQINVTARIGIDYAGEDALLPYRFLLNT